MPESKSGGLSTLQAASKMKGKRDTFANVASSAKSANLTAAEMAKVRSFVQIILVSNITIH